MNRARAEAPASSANLGPGFDVFAVALDKPMDKVEVIVEGEGSLEVKIAQASGAEVPLDPRKNGAGAAALALGEACGLRGKVKMTIWKDVPIGKGMGSSAASAAAAVVAMDEAFGTKLSKEQMVFFAGKGEEATSGAVHYDNVSASIMGGFVIIRKGNDGRPKLAGVKAPPRLRLCIATPATDLPSRKTEYARSILPKTVELGRMVENTAMASTIALGFANGDIGLIGEGMHDTVVEVARKTLIPGYDQVKSRAISAGACGVCISGAGPSMLSVADGDVNGRKVLAAMMKGFEEAGVKATGFMTRSGVGARVLG